MSLMETQDFYLFGGKFGSPLKKRLNEIPAAVYQTL